MNRKLIENGGWSSCDASSRRGAAGLLRIGPLIVGITTSLLLLLCSGCQTEQGAPFPEQRTASTPVRLTPGDVIKLSFTTTPDMNQTQRIRADGKVSLPLVGEVTAATAAAPAILPQGAGRSREWSQPPPTTQQGPPQPYLQFVSC